jgi:ABC-type multidrug transport system ATPase subunit
MLEALLLSRQLTPRDGNPRALLDSVSFSCPASQVTLVVGAPGSGKRSLLEVLTGIRTQDQGTLLLHGRDLARHPLHPNELGLVCPAEGSLPGQLTVRETLTSALLLRVGGLTREALARRTTHLLGLCGLETVVNEPVSQLSLVNLRRLLLATALVSDPVLVLCHDFTHDVDAKSERELVALLKLIATDLPGRVALNLTSSLAQLPAYDTVIVLHQGHVCFHGPARAIPHYFTIKTVEDLYPRLAMRPASRWGDSWSRHRDSYYDAFKIGTNAENLAPASEEDSPEGDPQRIRLLTPPNTPNRNSDEATSDADKTPAESPAGVPATLPRAGLIAQVSLLVRRRWILLRRSKREWRLHALLCLGLPALTVLLVWPNKAFITAALGPNASALPPETLWPAAFTCLMAAFLQVLMVIFLSVRNGAREIARERTLLNRERVAGVQPAAYLLSKVVFLTPLILAQTLWLGLVFEMLIGGLPGPAGIRFALLVLTGLAFTSLCLAISSRARSPERAHSLCLILAFGQVVLGGALLGMPRVLGGAVHPFITAYYGWSGMVDSMSPQPVFTAVSTLVRTWFATPSLAMTALAAHAILGLTITFIGLRKRSLP